MSDHIHYKFGEYFYDETENEIKFGVSEKREYRIKFINDKILNIKIKYYKNFFTFITIKSGEEYDTILGDTNKMEIHYKSIWIKFHPTIFLNAFMESTY